MSRRKRQSKGLRFLELPLLPFLSTMLGLMSVMALTAMAVTVERRQAREKQTLVELVGVPSEFIPVNIRCKPESVQWLTDDGQWRELTTLAFLSLCRKLVAPAPFTPEEQDFIDFLRAKAAANRGLSYSRRQHTLLLWVEPLGIGAYNLMQLMVAELDLPIRIGRLPVLERERIFNPAAAGPPS